MLLAKASVLDFIFFPCQKRCLPHLLHNILKKLSDAFTVYLDSKHCGLE